jgi:hypothetical protein
MRPILLLAACLVAAGCVTPSTTPTPDANNSTNSTMDMGMLPAPINETKDVQGGVQPVRDPATNDPCSLPTSGCLHHKFDVAAPATMEATLSWGLQANDFDLVLYLDGKEVAADTNPPPGTSAKLSAELEPGSYDLVVVPATVSQDTYKLAATFSSA